ncbi:chitin deacetylase [Mortierella sp. AD011]|nr:chitin deacetylase [Mortierella sp. AD010]KAF9401966.1 chitin deacetylase [Mortierella sp. AD011]
MVKFVASSLAALVLTVATIQAQSTTSPTVAAAKTTTTAAAAATTTITWPEANKVPPTNSAEVQAWLKEVDLTGAPDIELHTGDPPSCPNPPIANECYWTCDGCADDDITDCARPNTWGLTFDDGPSTDTPTLLTYLKGQNLAASFFLIGSNVVQYPEIVKQEVAEGHHLASHTWSHHALTTLTNEQIVAEMRWTEKAVMEYTGLKLKYMRPPYGDINARVRFVLKKLGYIPVDWTGDEFDTNDWQMPTMSESTVISTFTKSLDAYAASNKTTGFYCLEHDLNNLTVGVAQKIIPLGLARNITIAPIPVCESDASPYQNSNAVTTTTAATNGTTATSTSASQGATSSSSTSGNQGKTSGAESRVAGSALSAIAGAAVAGLLLA